ncbi:MAG: 3-carboxy-cis,cis-muconate cycloisomerase, partial [Candidatus Limnocylindrales bacterium]
VSAKACAERASGLVATLHASMIQEHERAAGKWHAEWRPWTDLLVTVGSAAAWLRDCLTHLRVDPARMRANLDLTGGLLLSERIAGALTPDLGRREAHQLVADACARAQDSGRPLVDALSAMPEVTEHLKTDAIERLLDPSTYLGTADLSIDRALAAHRSRRADGGA